MEDQAGKMEELSLGNLEIEGLPDVQKITLVEGEGEDSADIYFSRQAFHAMAKHLGVTTSTLSGNKEAAGVFFGIHGTTNGRVWTRVDHYYPLADHLIHREGTDVRFSSEAISEASHYIDTQYPNEDYTRY